MDEALDTERQKERGKEREESRSEKELTAEFRETQKVYIESNLETKQLCASLLAKSMEDSWGPQSIHTVEENCEKKEKSRGSVVQWNGKACKALKGKKRAGDGDGDESPAGMEKQLALSKAGFRAAPAVCQLLL